MGNQLRCRRKTREDEKFSQQTILNMSCKKGLSLYFSISRNAAVSARRIDMTKPRHDSFKLTFESSKVRHKGGHWSTGLQNQTWLRLAGNEICIRLIQLTGLGKETAHPGALRDGRLLGGFLAASRWRCGCCCWRGCSASSCWLAAAAGEAMVSGPEARSQKRCVCLL